MAQEPWFTYLYHVLARCAKLKPDGRNSYSVSVLTTSHMPSSTRDHVGYIEPSPFESVMPDQPGILARFTAQFFLKNTTNVTSDKTRKTAASTYFFRFSALATAYRQLPSIFNPFARLY